MNVGLDNSVVVTMNSTFKYWYVDENTESKPVITENGTDSINFIGSSGINIISNTVDPSGQSNTYPYQSLTFELSSTVEDSGTSNLNSRIYGDGSDGDIILGGTTSNSYMTLSNSTYFLINDLYANNITISGNTNINPNGFRLFVNGTLTNSSGNNYISCNGLNGQNSAGLIYGPGGISGFGNNSSGHGGNGLDSTQGWPTVPNNGESINYSFSTTQNGGNDSGNEGAVILATTYNFKNYYKSWLNIYNMHDTNGNYYTGGSGGARSGSGNGGGDGVAGSMALFIKNINISTGSTLNIATNGGNGYTSDSNRGDSGFILLCTSSTLPLSDLNITAIGELVSSTSDVTGSVASQAGNPGRCSIFDELI